MFIYLPRPITDWTGWLTESEFLAKLVDDREDQSKPHWLDYQRFRVAAFGRAMENGAKDAVDPETDGPHVAAIPMANGSCSLMMAWRDEAGNTWVASPIPLPWLEGGTAKWPDDGTSAEDIKASPSGQPASRG
jgi:hypothetical protein